MKVFAVVRNSWNDEYGYDEYSLPIAICTDEEEAKRVAASDKSEDYSNTIVVPYILK